MFRQTVFASLFALAAAAPLHADPAPRTVVIGGINNILIETPARLRGSIVLMTGGGGRLDAAADGSFSKGQDNAVIRTRQAYLNAGFDVLLVELGTDLSAAVNQMASLKRPVTVLTTSRGTLRAAEGIAAGARPDRLILTSGFLTAASGSDDNVETILGTPSKLPPTLIIHHRQDGCRTTNPAGVAPFAEWAGRKVVKVVWIDGGKDEGNACQPAAHHGFNGVEDQFTRAVIDFAGGK